MKRFRYTLFSIMIALAFALCGCGSTADTSFGLSVEKPWNNNGINYEKMVYVYEKINSDGETVATGKYTVEITSSVSGETEIKTSLTVVDLNTGISDSVTSKVVMNSVSLYPKYSEKTVVDKHNDNGYTLVMDYANKTSTMTFSKEETSRDVIVLPEPGQEVYDNEQLFYVVRAADNLGTSGNSGIFTIINGVDTYVYGEVKSYDMIYSVGDPEVVKCVGMGGKYGVNQDENIPARKVTVKINAARTGSGTSLYFAADEFTGGGKNVPVRITRAQFSTSSLSVEYNHVYTLSDYSAH